MAGSIVNLDMEERLLRAFRELLLADEGVAAAVGDRVWWYGDGSHKAAYPCILLNLPDATVSGMMELGWYELHLQILGAVFRPDDKSLAVMRSLEGLIRGFIMQKDLPAQLTATAAARSPESALTVVDARYENDVAEEDGQQNQIYTGTTVVVVCAPHNAAAVRPSPVPPGEYDPKADEGETGTIETNQNQENGNG